MSFWSHGLRVAHKSNERKTQDEADAKIHLSVYPIILETKTSHHDVDFAQKFSRS